MRTLIVFIILVLVNNSGWSQTDSLKYYYNNGLESYKKSDFKTFEKCMKKANSYHPLHPTIIYNLAAAYSLNYKINESSEILKEYIMMNAITNIQEDLDFQNVLNSKNGADLLSLKNHLNRKIKHSEIALEFELENFHPEAIEYKNNSYYFGDVRWIKVVSVNHKACSVLGPDNQEGNLLKI